MGGSHIQEGHRIWHLGEERSEYAALSLLLHLTAAFGYKHCEFVIFRVPCTYPYQEYSEVRFFLIKKRHRCAQRESCLRLFHWHMEPVYSCSSPLWSPLMRNFLFSISSCIERKRHAHRKQNFRAYLGFELHYSLNVLCYFLFVFCSMFQELEAQIRVHSPLSSLEFIYILHVQI